jgi:D-arginine utilization repressor
MTRVQTPQLVARPELPATVVPATRIALRAGSEQLSPFFVVADAIDQLFQPYSEVVVNDLRAQSVAHLANKMSKREVSDESALDDIGVDTDETVLGPYEKLGWRRRTVRSISAVLGSGDWRGDWSHVRQLPHDATRASEASALAFLVQPHR